MGLVAMKFNVVIVDHDIVDVWNPDNKSFILKSMNIHENDNSNLQVNFILEQPQVP